MCQMERIEVAVMNAVVVYESHWGNTANIARAIAQGFGPEARALPTDEATEAVVSQADLVVAGAPLMAFRLPTDKMLDSVASDRKAPTPGDLSHPSMRSWLERLPQGHGQAASFETRMWWSPGGATGAIDKGLAAAGYRAIDKGHRFIVKGSYGPLRDGELERARQWGAELARSMSAAREGAD